MFFRRDTTDPRRPVTAWVTALALGAAGTFAITQTGAENPSYRLADTATPAADTVKLATQSFAEGLTVLLGDPGFKALDEALGGQGSRTIKEFSRNEKFSMFALTWNGPRDIDAMVRSLKDDGTWSTWFPAHTITGQRPDGVNGTQMIYVEPTTKVQVSTRGVAIEPGKAAPPAGGPAPQADPASARNEDKAAHAVPAPAGALPSAVPGPGAAGAPAKPGAPATSPALTELDKQAPAANAAPGNTPPAARVAPIPNDPPPAAPPAPAAAPVPEAPPASAAGAGDEAARNGGPLPSVEEIENGRPVEEEEHAASAVPKLGTAMKSVPFGSPNPGQRGVTVAAPAAPASAPTPATPAPADQPTALIDADKVSAVFVEPGKPVGVQADLAAIDDDLKGIPRIITRKGWLPQGGKHCDKVDPKVSAIAISSTGGSNDYTPEQVPGMLKAIYEYETGSLGWCDVGANAYVDKFGRIFEGRAGGLNKAVHGQHTAGFNDNTWGVSLMGEFTGTAPSEQSIQAAGELAGWRAHVAGFDPTGTDTHFSSGSPRYPKGTPVNLPNVFASTDVNGFPADEVAKDIPTIRKTAKARYDEIKAGDFDKQAQDTLNKYQQAQRERQRETTGHTNTSPGGSDAVAALKTLIPGLADVDLNAGSSTAKELNDLIANPNAGSLVKVVGSLAALAVGVAVARGGLPASVAGLGDREILGLKLRDVPVLVTKILDLTGDNSYSRTWHSITAAAGPVLGKPVGGPAPVTPAGPRNSQITVVPFERGLIVSSPEAGTHGIWGKIGDAWAEQGFDAGPLGLPISEEHPVAGGLVRTDFQGGSITFDPATGTTTVHPTARTAPPPAPMPQLGDRAQK